MNRSTIVVILLLVAISRPAATQETHIHGFADVTFSGRSNESAPATFGLGQYAFFVSSKVADRVTFLGESVFESNERGDFQVDVERAIITFAASEHVRVSAGKHHTPIGFWNNAYHHGTALQPTIARPGLFRFEDEGGILPIHALGVQLSGRDLTPAHLGWELLVANNSGSTPEQDRESRKAVAASLHAELTSALRVGVSYYGDRIPEGTPTRGEDSLATSLRQRIAGGYVAYFAAGLELIGEYQHLRDQPADATSAASRSSHGVVAYGGYRIGKVVPFLLYDETTVPAGDPYLPFRADRIGTAGVRYEYAPAAVLKLELRREKSAGLRWGSALAVQAAIGF